MNEIVPCAIVYPDGRVQGGKSVRHIKRDSVESALVKLANDHAAWVAPDDVDEVLRIRQGRPA